jgi:hypothetical protein
MISKNPLPLEQRIDLTPSQKRMWRTLVRVDSLDEAAGLIKLVIPGISVSKTFEFNLKDFPAYLASDIKKSRQKPYRFHIQSNIGVADINNLYLDFTRYEAE